MIESCWSQCQDERPTFEQIVDELKNNADFVTDTMDQEIFEDYVAKIDDFISSNPVKIEETESDSFSNEEEEES